MHTIFTQRLRKFQSVWLFLELRSRVWLQFGLDRSIISCQRNWLCSDCAARHEQSSETKDLECLSHSTKSIHRLAQHSNKDGVSKPTGCPLYAVYVVYPWPRALASAWLCMHSGQVAMDSTQHAVARHIACNCAQPLQESGEEIDVSGPSEHVLRCIIYQVLHPNTAPPHLLSYLLLIPVRSSHN